MGFGQAETGLVLLCGILSCFVTSCMSCLSASIYLSMEFIWCPFKVITQRPREKGRSSVDYKTRWTNHVGESMSVLSLCLFTSSSSFWSFMLLAVA